MDTILAPCTKIVIKKKSMAAADAVNTLFIYLLCHSLRFSESCIRYTYYYNNMVKHTKTRERINLDGNSNNDPHAILYTTIESTGNIITNHSVYIYTHALTGESYMSVHTPCAVHRINNVLYYAPATQCTHAHTVYTTLLYLNIVLRCNSNICILNNTLSQGTDWLSWIGK